MKPPTPHQTRVARALAHEVPDRAPLDLGATPVTGMHVSSVYRLRQALRLDPPGAPVRVTNIYQMLGEIAPDLQEALGVDLVPLPRQENSFGIANEGWKPFVLWDGTPTLVPGGFNTAPEPNGDLLMYPQGDRSAAPSGRMPAGGYYFDALIRQPPIEADRLRIEDNLEEFGPLSSAALEWAANESRRLAEHSGRAIVANMGGTGFGDIALVPGIQLKQPRGIRDIEEWYVSTLTRKDFIYKIFERQCEIALSNLERFHAAVGERVTAIYLSGTDFGGQTSLLVSPRSYRELYQPFQKRLNDWIHTHTTWKTFIHTDGAIRPLIPDLLAAGFDLLNPVQWSAAGMDPAELKASFGERLTFWGGGVDAQHTLPFGTPEQVRQEVRRALEVFGKGGGYVFAGVHNLQAGAPVANLLAFFNAFHDHAGLSGRP